MPSGSATPKQSAAFGPWVAGVAQFGQPQQQSVAGEPGAMRSRRASAGLAFDATVVASASNSADEPAVAAIGRQPQEQIGGVALRDRVVVVAAHAAVDVQASRAPLRRGRCRRHRSRSARRSDLASAGPRASASVRVSPRHLPWPERISSNPSAGRRDLGGTGRIPSGSGCNRCARDVDFAAAKRVASVSSSSSDTQHEPAALAAFQNSRVSTRWTVPLNSLNSLCRPGTASRRRSSCRSACPRAAGSSAAVCAVGPQVQRGRERAHVRAATSLVSMSRTVRCNDSSLGSGAVGTPAHSGLGSGTIAAARNAPAEPPPEPPAAPRRHGS